MLLEFFFQNPGFASLDDPELDLSEAIRFPSTRFRSRSRCYTQYDLEYILFTDWPFTD